MNSPRSYFSGFVSLLFPELCAACRESLMENEKLICTECRYTLPYTNFHLHAGNAVAQQFWGRVDLQGAYAMLHFVKGGKVQNLMHQLKYRGVQQVGNLLGNMAAEQLLQNEAFSTAEVIIPVPLHKRRLRERGYNQSDCFAQGIAEKMNIPADYNNLVRTRSTETQTHKSRFERSENMREVFDVLHPQRLAGKHILLVDDVVTTGATLEACALELLKIDGVRMSVAAIAFAE